MQDLAGATDNDKLHTLCAKSYKEQAQWFLNSFWDKLGGEAEKLWAYVDKCAQLDTQNHGEGSALDEMMAHRFLETIGETLTVMALRDKLRSTGALSATERPKTVPIVHYLIFKYGIDWRYLVNTKGDNSGEIAKAQAMLDQVSIAFAEAERTTEVARQAEAYAREQEAPFKAAQEEVDSALAEVKAQEDARNNKIADLTAKGQAGGVSGGRAKAELAQVLAEDPLPLRKAKITLEAALKKAEKARAPFDAATKAAAAARADAEAALDEAARQVAEAEAYLAEVKSRPGTAHGSIWWMERELHEKKKFLPTSRGGIAKK